MNYFEVAFGDGVERIRKSGHLEVDSESTFPVLLMFCSRSDSLAAVCSFFFSFSSPCRNIVKRPPVSLSES